MARGKFIVFEGIDGCGKGTQMKKAAGYIFSLSKLFDVSMTREPTRDFAEIRKRMASGQRPEDDRLWYMAQFTADRLNHCVKYVSGDLERGTQVLSDRYYHSTLTYQNAQGIEFATILAMQRQNGIIIPDITLIYDCPTAIAFERRRAEGATDVFEKDVEFQEKLRRLYLELPNKLPKEKVVVIDGSLPVDEVFQQTQAELDKILKG